METGRGKTVCGSLRELALRAIRALRGLRVKGFDHLCAEQAPRSGELQKQNADGADSADDAEKTKVSSAFLPVSAPV
jgi:hypothetical protein